MIGLTVLDDPCAGCGACCEYMGVPPGFALAYESETPASWHETEDGLAWRALPAPLRATLDDYYQGVREGRIEDREDIGDPCLWYDMETRRCSHYAWRPSACRAFAAGSGDCLAIREYAGR